MMTAVPGLDIDPARVVDPDNEPDGRTELDCDPKFRASNSGHNSLFYC